MEDPRNYTYTCTLRTTPDDGFDAPKQYESAKSKNSRLITFTRIMSIARVKNSEEGWGATLGI